MVHWDLWDTNVFVDPATLEVVGIIDFERVLWADPLMEAQFTNKRAHDRSLDAYGKRLFDEPLAVERRRLYDLYLYLVMFVECSYRNYPTPDIENLAIRVRRPGARRDSAPPDPRRPGVTDRRTAALGGMTLTPKQEELCAQSSGTSPTCGRCSSTAR